MRTLFVGAVHQYCCSVLTPKGATAKREQRGPDEANGPNAVASGDRADDLEVHRCQWEQHKQRVVPGDLSNESAGQVVARQA